MTTAFFYHLAYDFRVGLRDKNHLLMNYLFPLLFYAMMGALMGGMNPEFKVIIIPAMITFATLSSALLGLPNPLVSARETGVLRSYKINGVPAINLIVIPALSVMVHIMAVAVIIALTAGPLFGGTTPQGFGWVVLFCLALLGAFAMTGMGMLIGVVSPNSRATILFSQLFFIPSMMLGGLIVPTSMLPKGLSKIALILPSSYAMNLYNTWLLGKPASMDPVASAVILVVGGLLAFALAIALFEWDSKKTGKRRSPFLALVALLPYIVGMIFLG